MNTKNNEINKTILVLRDAGEKSIKITTAIGGDTKVLRDSLNDFLLKNFGITEIKQHLIHGDHNGSVESFLVKLVDDQDFYSVYNGMMEKARRHEGGETELNNVSDSDLINFIYGLVLQGSLSFAMHVLRDKKQTIETMPMILLAELMLAKNDRGESDNNYFIRKFATNDPLLIDIDVYTNSSDKHEKYSYSNRVHADDAIKRMTRHGTFDRDERYPDLETVNEGLPKTIHFKENTGYNCKGGIIGISDTAIVKNSLLLSTEFLEVFLKESGRDFGFNQRTMTSINNSVITHWGRLPTTENNKLLHPFIRSIAMNGTSKGLLEEVLLVSSKEDDKLSEMLERALNDYFFNKNYEEQATAKKNFIVTDGSKIIPIDTDMEENANYAYGSVDLGRIITCITDMNKAGEVLEMTLCESISRGFFDNSGDYNAHEMAKITYSLTLSNSTNGVFEIERIHKSMKIGVLVNKMAGILRSRNSDGQGYLDMNELMPLLHDSFAIYGNEDMLKVSVSQL